MPEEDSVEPVAACDRAKPMTHRAKPMPLQKSATFQNKRTEQLFLWSYLSWAQGAVAMQFVHEIPLITGHHKTWCAAVQGLCPLFKDKKSASLLAYAAVIEEEYTVGLVTLPEVSDGPFTE